MVSLVNEMPRRATLAHVVEPEGPETVLPLSGEWGEGGPLMGPVIEIVVKIVEPKEELAMDEQPQQDPKTGERRKAPAAPPRSTAATQAQGEACGQIRFVEARKP
jgi:hypothetical protein